MRDGYIPLSTPSIRSALAVIQRCAGPNWRHGCESRDAATASGTQAMVLVGALLALPIDWYLISPIASKRDTVSRTLASVKAVLS